MEKDTVCISIKEYDNLRNLKSNIEDGKILTIETHSNDYGNYKRMELFYTDNEIISKLIKRNEKLQSENKSLRDNMKSFEKTVSDQTNSYNLLIVYLKGMTCRDFRKWRKSKLIELLK